MAARRFGKFFLKKTAAFFILRESTCSFDKKISFYFGKNNEKVESLQRKCEQFRNYQILFPDGCQNVLSLRSKSISLLKIMNQNHMLSLIF